MIRSFLPQTLLKTEILKNQLQIASISKSQGVNTTTSLLSALRTAEAPVTVMATSRPSPQQQQVASMSYELLAEGTSGGLRDLLPLPTLQQQQSLRSLSPSPTLAPEVCWVCLCVCVCLCVSVCVCVLLHVSVCVKVKEVKFSILIMVPSYCIGHTCITMRQPHHHIL